MILKEFVFLNNNCSKAATLQLHDAVRQGSFVDIGALFSKARSLMSFFDCATKTPDLQTASKLLNEGSAFYEKQKEMKPQEIWGYGSIKNHWIVPVVGLE